MAKIGEGALGVDGPIGTQGIVKRFQSTQG
jgi:hypothetical protein